MSGQGIGVQIHKTEHTKSAAIAEQIQAVDRSLALPSRSYFSPPAPKPAEQSRLKTPATESDDPKVIDARLRELSQRIESILIPPEVARASYFNPNGRLKKAWSNSVRLAREEIAVLEQRLNTLNPVPA